MARAHGCVHGCDACALWIFHALLRLTFLGLFTTSGLLALFSFRKWAVRVFADIRASPGVDMARLDCSPQFVQVLGSAD